MDNIQDTAQADPQGQSASVEQMPQVQSNETAQVSQTDGVQSEVSKPSDETSFESLAAKKGWKSPDDLAKAYANLESKNTQVSQRNANLEKQFFPEVKRQDNVIPRSPVYSQDEEQALLQLKQFVQKEVEPLQQQYETKLKTELAKIELRSVIKENPDFHKYSDSVKELKAKYPEMPFSEALTFAKALTGDSINAAKAEGLREGTRFAQKQTTAQVASNKSAAEEKLQTSDLLKGASRRWAIRQGMSPAEKARIVAEREMVERELQQKAGSERDFLAF